MLIEACVDTVTSALAAERGGGGRIELCADLCGGGTTPSDGTVAVALERLAIPVFPIIRPHGGGFVFDDASVAVMRHDLRRVRDVGANGAVIGALTADGMIDERVVGMLREDAPDLQLTFHRAFDLVPDLFAALETLAGLGVDRILTGGGCQTALEGRAQLAALVSQSRGRVVILAGGGINEENAAEIVRASGVQELHVRATVDQRDMGGEPRVSFRKAFPANPMIRPVTSADRIAAIRVAVAP